MTFLAFLGCVLIAVLVTAAVRTAFDYFRPAKPKETIALLALRKKNLDDLDEVISLIEYALDDVPRAPFEDEEPELLKALRACRKALAAAEA